MEWPIILVLAIAIPVILFPAAYIWYLNAGGLYQSVRDTLRRRASVRTQKATRRAKEVEIIR